MSAAKLEGETLTALLGAYVATEGDLLFPARKALMKPCAGVLDGRPVTVATNGKRLIVVDGDHSLGMVEGYPSSWPDVLPKNRTGAVDVSLREFRAFLGMHEKDAPDPCPKCAGKKQWPCAVCVGDGEVLCVCSSCEDEHQRDCETCDGEGSLSCPACTGAPAIGTYVWIGGVLFDAHQLVPALRHLPDERALLVPGDGYERRQRPMQLFGSGWRAIVMPIRADATQAQRYANAPRFALPIAEYTRDGEDGTRVICGQAADGAV